MDSLLGLIPAAVLVVGYLMTRFCPDGQSEVLPSPSSDEAAPPPACGPSPQGSRPLTSRQKSPGDSADTLGRLATKIFVFAGAAMFFLGIGTFVKYAYDAQWIGPAERLALALAASAAVVVLGITPRFARYGIWPRVVSGLGFACLHACVLIAATGGGVDDAPLWTPLWAVIVTLFVNAAAIVVSYRWMRPECAAVAMIGGLAGPLMYGMPDLGALALSAWLAILVGSVAVAAIPRRWAGLETLAAIGIGLNAAVWWERHGSLEMEGAAALFIACFGAGLLAWSGWNWQRRRPQGWSQAGASAILLTFAMMSGALYGLYDGHDLGWAFRVQSLAYLVAGGILYRVAGRANALVVLLGTLFVAAISLSWMASFSSGTLAAVFALQACAIHFASLRIDRAERFRINGFAALTALVGALFTSVDIVSQPLGAGQWIALAATAMILAFLSEVHRPGRESHGPGSDLLCVHYAFLALALPFFAGAMELYAWSEASFVVHRQETILAAALALVLISWGLVRNRLGMAFGAAAPVMVALLSAALSFDFGWQPDLHQPGFDTRQTVLAVLVAALAGSGLIAVSRRFDEKTAHGGVALATLLFLGASYLGLLTVSSTLDRYYPDMIPRPSWVAGLVLAAGSFLSTRWAPSPIRNLTFVFGALCTVGVGFSVLDRTFEPSLGGLGFVPRHTCWWLLPMAGVWAYVSRLLSRGHRLRLATFSSHLCFLVAQAMALICLASETWRLTHESDVVLPLIGPLAAAAAAVTSAVIALWALMQTGAGFALSDRRMEWFGCVLFLGVVLKVFLNDVPTLPVVPRILSYLSVGALLLAGSWMRSRHVAHKTSDEEPLELPQT